MTPIELLGFPQSNFVWAIRLLCAEKGADCTVVPTRPRTPDLQAIHPMGKMPALRQGDVQLFESAAIAHYLDATLPGPRLFPTEPLALARVEQWVSFTNTEVDPALIRRYVVGYAFPGTADGSPNRALIDAGLPQLNTCLALLDRAVASGFLANDTLSYADLNLMPVLHYVRGFPEAQGMLASLPSLSAYYARHSARATFQATIPPPMP
jgi:glutathione S-transferase